MRRTRHLKKRFLKKGNKCSKRRRQGQTRQTGQTGGTLINGITNSSMNVMNSSMNTVKKDPLALNKIKNMVGNMMENGGVKVIEKIGDTIGIDTNTPTTSIESKLSLLNQALKNPQNVQKMKELAQNATLVGTTVLQASKPLLQKFIDTTVPVAVDGMQKAIKAGIATGVNVAEDFLGPIIGIPRTVLSATEALNASVNVGANVLTGISETIEGTKANYNTLMNQKNQKNQQMNQQMNSINKMNMLGGRIHNSKQAFFNT